MRRALTVAKYLLKNQVVNPFLRRFKTLLLFAVVVGVLGGLLAVALFSGQPEAEEAEPEEGPGVREFLREFGVDKWAVLDLGSAALTAGLLLILIQGRDYVTVMEEAEYELLLAQPISMEEYFLGRELATLAFTAGLSLPYLGFVPLALELSGGSPKALLLPLAMLIPLQFSSALAGLATAARALLGERARLLRWGAAAYLLAGLAHSLAEMRPSPLLRLSSLSISWSPFWRVSLNLCSSTWTMSNILSLFSKNSGNCLPQ